MNRRPINPEIFERIYPWGIPEEALPFVYFGTIGTTALLFCLNLVWEVRLWIVPGWVAGGVLYGFTSCVLSIWATRNRKRGWAGNKVKAFLKPDRFRGFRPGDSAFDTYLIPDE